VFPHNRLAAAVLVIGPVICSEDLDVGYVHRVARLNPNLCRSAALGGLETARRPGNTWRWRRFGHY